MADLFVGTLMGLFGLGIILAYTWPWLRPAWRRAISKNWPQVLGTVESGSIKELSGDGGTLYHLEIAFSNIASGQRYAGYHTVRLGDYSSGARLLRAVAHSSITVRYNPSKPNDCVVDVAEPGGWGL